MSSPEMRFLAVFNRHLIAGGEDQSHNLEMQLLRERGHRVDEYLVDNREIENLGLIRTGLRTIWSQESYREMRKRLHAHPYTAVLVQNAFPLISPSVLHACRAEGVPVLYFIRNYRLFCLNGYFFRDGQVCEDCYQQSIPLAGIQHRCYRGSLAGSVTTATMTVFHRTIGTWKRCVSGFVALNPMMRDKMVTAGMDAGRIFVRPNFIHPDPGCGAGERRGVMFAGRLSPEKGVDWLARTWIEEKIEIPLSIYGSGPLESVLGELAASSPYVSLMGRCASKEVLGALGQSRVLVLPSLWYEGMPRIILEALAKGTPVVAAKLGGMQDLVQEGENGFLFAPGDSKSLKMQIQRLFTDEANWQRLSLGARRSYEERYTADRAYLSLMMILEQVQAQPYPS